jgi:hypothetical protein
MSDSSVSEYDHHHEKREAEYAGLCTAPVMTSHGILLRMFFHYQIYFEQPPIKLFLIVDRVVMVGLLVRIVAREPMNISCADRNSLQ